MGVKRSLCLYSGEVKELATGDSLYGGGSGMAWSVIDIDTNAASNCGYLINASSGNITLTLPLSPAAGDIVGVCDAYNQATTNNIAIGRNGQNIEGAASDLGIDVNGAGLVLVYADTTRGWEIISEIGTDAGTILTSSISDGDTTHAPDGNSIFDALALKAPLASPAFTGNAGFTAAALSALWVTLARNAGYAGGFLIATDATNRWSIYCSNTAEGGSDAGSNFVIGAYDDAGAGLGTAFSIARATRIATFAETLTVAKGIKFPATQVVSTDVNTLDDYEKGDWDIALLFGGNAVDMTYSTQDGAYLKIGGEVLVTGSIILTAKGSSTGAATIAGLPFPVRNDAGCVSAPSFRIANISFADFFQGYVAASGTSVILQESNNAGTVTNITDADFTNTSSLRFALLYRTT